MKTDPGPGEACIPTSARRGIAFGLVMVAWTVAGAARGQSFQGEFPIPTPGAVPLSIVAGPDGNVWFTESERAQIGRITTGGVITEFPLPRSNSFLGTITTGPDNNLWFTESDRIGRITRNGEITEFRVRTDSPGAYGITNGPDGALWFTEANRGRIGRITTDGEITEFTLPQEHSNGNKSNRVPWEIVKGSDGNLWFTDKAQLTNVIGRITTSGVSTEFPIPTAGCPEEEFFPGHTFPNCGLSGITAGPDGNLWYLAAKGNKVGRMTTTGAVTEFPIPTSFAEPTGITTGPDGNLWFTEHKTNKIGRITTSGAIAEFVIPADSSQPNGITTGPDGYLWFAEGRANKIGRMSTASTGPCEVNPTTLCLNKSRFKLQLTWSKSNGQGGAGQAIPLTEDTGYFWFLNSENVEIVIKVVKGTGGVYWVFYGALSGVQYTITVTDTVTGNVKTYENPYGTLRSVADTSGFTPSSGIVGNDPDASLANLEIRAAEELDGVFAALTPATDAPKAAAEGCTTGGTTLCVNQSRFQVTLDWRQPSTGRSGQGMATAITDDTGYFWFFNEDNVELVIKVLRGNNGFYWVYYGALTGLETTITVTDTLTGAVKTYPNPSGPPVSFADINAFPF